MILPEEEEEQKLNQAEVVAKDQNATTNIKANSG
jgi:hypothetical protein